MDKQFTLVFIDGASMTYDRLGVLVALTDQEGKELVDVDGYSLGNGCPDVHGIWDDDEKCTIPWDEVVDYEHTDFHLTAGMFLDNGQVINEGEIVKILIDGEVKWDVDSNEDYVELFHRFRDELPAYEAYYEAVHQIVEDYGYSIELVGKHTIAVHEAYKALPEEEL